MFNLAGTDPDTHRLTLQTTPPIGYDSYDNTITDYYQPSTQEALDFIHALEQATGFPVYMYNYDDPSALGVYPSGKLRPNFPAIQVLHNVWFQTSPSSTSLFTFIFPPYWQPTGTYPILLSGDGGSQSNNTMFTYEQTRFIATQVGQSLTATGSRTGLIAALSNSGGRESQGWNDNALLDVKNMLQFMGTYYGVNRYKVVNFGGSRGGGTALLWGENPGPYDYTSIGVFGMAAPSHPGYISQQALASYQGLAGLAIGIFNDTNADRYSFWAGQMIDVKPSPILQVLLDVGDPGLADRYNPGETNPKGASGYLNKLQGKESVVLSVGTHDAIIPLPMILKLDRTLWDDWGVKRLLCITLRTGHKGDEDTCPRLELVTYLTYLTTPQQGYIPPNERRYYISTDIPNHLQGNATQLTQQTTLPFSITVPYRLTNGNGPAGGGQWATLAACGESGKTYTATLNSGGTPIHTVTNTFNGGSTSDFRFDGTVQPDPECDVIRLDQQTWWQNLATGTYTWTFTYNGQTVPNTYLSFSDANLTVATTVLEASQPSTQDAAVVSDESITMGVDQF